MSDVLGQHAASLAAPDQATAHTVQPLSVRRIDPRIRILAACSFAIAIVSLSDFGALLLGLAFSVTAMFLARLKPVPTLKRVMMMDSFILFMLVLLPFTTPGEPAFSVLGFQGSWAGILKACEIGLKANAIVMMLLSLVGTLEAVTFGHALARLRVPVSLVHLMLFTVRYIEVIHEEYRRLRMAMKARAFVARNSAHTYQSVGYLVGMLLVRSMERSERILQAMRCRGFNGQFHLLDALRLRRRDFMFSGIFLTALLMLFIIEGAHVAPV
ncbi:MAG: cobalt ECF transporter T component CbiQ [Stappiaceae bacterium]